MSRSILAINAEAHQYHQSGLEELSTGNVFDAALCLNVARQVLNSSERTLEAVVQEARVTREYGLAYLRVQGDNLLPNVGHDLLKESVELTLPVVKGTETLPIRTMGANGEPRQARREAFAEHGKTISWLGRTAARRAEASASNNGNEASAGPTSGQIYELAHEYLRMGNKGWDRVGNAIVAARDEYSNERRRPQMIKWLGRAAYGVAWTGLREIKTMATVLGAKAMRSPRYQAARRTFSTGRLFGNAPDRVPAD